jgi:UDP-GlcNAc:undecaprenyl-phosphate GlcNAc-1-phosphate transferase
MTSILLLALPAVIAAAMTFFLVRPVRALAFRIGAIDLPGPRKIHRQPMARLGGLAVVAGCFLVFAILTLVRPAGVNLLPARVMTGIAIGLLPIFVISFVDDMRGVRAMPKLMCHLLGAGIAASLGARVPDAIQIFGLDVHLGLLALPISLMWIAGVTNAFNIIDGLDGLSAGLALISSMSLAAVSLVSGQYATATASLILAGGLIGFLPYNLYPAKIFLGDTGATAIGFVLACLTLAHGAVQSQSLAVSLPLLIVGVPLADTAISIVRRAVAKFEGTSRGVFEADSRHIHHRLLALGLNQWRAALILYTTGAVFAFTALLSLFLEHRKAALLLIGILTAAFVGIFKLGYDEFAVWRKDALLKIYDAPVLRFGLFIAFIDIAMVVVALYAASILKYDYSWRLASHGVLTTQLLALLPPLTVSVFALLGVYRSSWRQANVDDMLALAAAVLTTGFTGYLCAAMFIGSEATPTFFVLFTMCLFALVGTSRLSYRVLCHWQQVAKQQGEPIVIYGAGVGGSLALREIQTNDGVPMIPVGFIDDDPTKSGRRVNGYPVFGSVAALHNIVMSHGVRGIVVASEKIPIAKVRQAQTLCNDADIWIRHFRVSFQEDNS